MFCRFCGKEITGEFMYCPFCGKTQIVQKTLQCVLNQREDGPSETERSVTDENEENKEEKKEQNETVIKPEAFYEFDEEEKYKGCFVLKDSNLPIKLPPNRFCGHVSILIASLFTTFFCLKYQVVTLGALVIFSVFFLPLCLIENLAMKRRYTKQYISSMEKMRFRSGSIKQTDFVSIVKALEPGKHWNAAIATDRYWVFSRAGRKYEVLRQDGEFSIQAANRKVYKSDVHFVASDVGSLAYTIQLVSFDGMLPKNNVIETAKDEDSWRPLRVVATIVAVILLMVCVWRGYQADQISKVQFIKPFETSSLNWKSALEKHCTSIAWRYYTENGKKYVSFAGLCDVFGDGNPQSLNIVWEIERVSDGTMIDIVEVLYHAESWYDEQFFLFSGIFDLNIVEEAAARRSGGENEETEIPESAVQINSGGSDSSANTETGTGNNGTDDQDTPYFGNEQVCGTYLQVIDEASYSIAQVDYIEGEGDLLVYVDCFNYGLNQYTYSANLTYQQFKGGMDYYYDKEFPMTVKVKPGYLEMVLDNNYEVPSGLPPAHLYIYNVAGGYHPTDDDEIERVYNSSINPEPESDLNGDVMGEYQRIDMDYFDCGSGTYRNIYTYLVVYEGAGGGIYYSFYTTDINTEEILEDGEGELIQTGPYTYDTDDGHFGVKFTDSECSFGSYWAWSYIDGPLYKIE